MSATRTTTSLHKGTGNRDSRANSNTTQVSTAKNNSANGSRMESAEMLQSNAQSLEDDHKKSATQTEETRQSSGKGIPVGSGKVSATGANVKASEKGSGVGQTKSNGSSGVGSRKTSAAVEMQNGSAKSGSEKISSPQGSKMEPTGSRNSSAHHGTTTGGSALGSAKESIGSGNKKSAKSTTLEPVPDEDPVEELTNSNLNKLKSASSKSSAITIEEDSEEMKIDGITRLQQSEDFENGEKEEILKVSQEASMTIEALQTASDSLLQSMFKHTDDIFIEKMRDVFDKWNRQDNLKLLVIELSLFFFVENSISFCLQRKKAVACCKKGRVKKLTKILEKSDLNYDEQNVILTNQPNGGENLLNLAVEFHQSEIVEYLLKSFGKFQWSVNGNGENALHIAARNNDIQCGQILLSSKYFATEDRVRNETNFTSLHLAASNNCNDFMQMLLLAYKAELFSRCQGGKTALHIVVEMQRLEACKMLSSWRKGALLWQPDDNGELPVIYAIRLCDNDLIRLLCEKSYSPPVDSIEVTSKLTGRNCLQEAVHIGRSDIVKMMIDEFGARVNAKNSKGLTALHMAASMNNCDMIECLFNLKAQVCYKRKL